jgi:diguanylate cyclase (GGDEF)-like protein
LRRALDFSSEAFMLHQSDGTLLYANSVARTLIGGLAVGRGWPYRPPITRALVEGIIPEARRRGSWTGDVDLRDGDGNMRTLAITVTIVTAGDVTSDDVSSADVTDMDQVLIVARDETKRRIAERNLAVRADTDPLTRLLNREAFMAAVERSLGVPSEVAMLFVDLDRFKSINDTLGHSAGDDVLLATASRLRTLLTPGDLLGRLGGDEFVILVTDLDDTAPVVQRARDIAAKALRVIADPLPLGAQDVYVTASVGLTVADATATDPGAMLRHADLAMFHAKSSGRNRTVEFTAELAERATRRVRMQSALHEALRNDELVVMYQPIVSGADADLVGFEALVRWRQPDGSLIAPAEFLEVAELSDLITHIDTYVLRTACAELAEWTRHRPELAHITMSVNVSSRQLRRPDLSAVVGDALVKAGLQPSRLALEVTESVLMEDFDSAHVSLDELKLLGVRIAFDDFGTGHCTMGYLRLFNAHILKIDRSFVATVTDNAADEQVVRAIAQLADAFGMQTIAEGVETEAQRDLLQRIGCDTMQGYLFDRPLLSADAAVRMVRTPRV